MTAPSAAGEGAPATRLLAALALGLACASFGFEGVLRPAAGGFEGFIDFAPYYKGAAALARGLDPYALAVTDRLGEELGVTEGKGMRYLYPPFFGLVAAPLALLPYPLAKAAWHGLGLASLAGAVLLLPGALLAAPAAWERGLVLFLAASFLPVVETLRLGQVNLLLLLLLVLALRESVRGRDGRAGLAVGLAAAIKVTPALLLPLFLLRRRWKGLAIGVGAAAGLTLLGFLLAPAGSWGSFARSVLPWYANGHSWAANQSPQGFLLRLLAGSSSPIAPDPSETATRTAAVLARILAAGFLAATFLALARRRSAPLPEQFGLLLATLPLVTAIAWVHHLALLLPAFAAVFLGPRRNGERSRRETSCAILAFALVALPLGYDHPRMLRPALLPLVSSKLLGSLLLWGILLRRAWTSRAAEELER